VDQIGLDGRLLTGPDTQLSKREKNALLLGALPGAYAERFAGVDAVRYQDQVLFMKQVTYLGNTWPVFKKRIQIPKKWIDAHQHALAEGLTPRFVGIYRHEDVTIFVDFDPSTYVRRKANNSAAHVSTNDLYQAQTLGAFSREDRNGNRITSVPSDQLADYLSGHTRTVPPRVEAFSRFNSEFLSHDRTEALDAIREMYDASWPDRFQGEWAGFYLEFRLDRFLRENRLAPDIEFQRTKTKGAFDYDLVFRDHDRIDHYGDLKASNITALVSPGNDAADIRRCVETFGRFWYVIYEHETWHGHQDGDRPTIAWNEWKRSVGYANSKGFDPLSYARRFKAAVRYSKMSILEVNEANFGLVLGDFHQGKQPDGAARALKVMITKKNIENFLIYSESRD
jgi:hypothetical protein